MIDDDESTVTTAELGRLLGLELGRYVVAGKAGCLASTLAHADDLQPVMAALRRFVAAKVN